MSAQKTLAFVLKTQDYRDTSLMASFYTRDFGKVRAIIKGGRDAKNRYGSTLEPFSLNEIIVYHRKRGDLHLVTAAELVERFEPLRRDLGRLGLAMYFLEVVDQMTDASQAHEELFELLADALKSLSRTSNPSCAARVFEVKFMRLMGFMPELSSCVRCEEVQIEDGYFSIPSGGLVCETCRKGEGPLVLATREAVAFLTEAAEQPFAGIDGSMLDEETGRRVEKLMRQFVDYHLTYRPKSLVFLEKMGAF